MGGDDRAGKGRAGELAAARYLRRRGYRIVDRNFRTRFGELDLVVQKRGTLVFCEVKARVWASGASRAPPTFHPFDSVGPQKQARLRRLASSWLAARPGTLGRAPLDVRFDVIGVRLGRGGRVLGIEHLANAFGDAVADAVGEA